MLGRGDEIPAPIPFYSKEGGGDGAAPEYSRAFFLPSAWLALLLPPSLFHSPSLFPLRPNIGPFPPPSFLLSLILRSAVRRSLGPSSCPRLPHAS